MRRALFVVGMVVCAFAGSGDFLYVSSAAAAPLLPLPHELADRSRPLTLAKYGQFGLRLVDLNDAQRRRLERNTGAVVVKVFDNTPAFFANILVDDVIIAINGQPVGTAADAVAKLRALDHTAGPATVTVLRRGQQKTITVTFR